MQEPTPPSVPYYTSPLYRLLMAHFPAHRSTNGLLDIPNLCKDLGFSKTMGYRWVQSGHIALAPAKALMKLSEADGNNPLTMEQIVPFVFD